MSSPVSSINHYAVIVLNWNGLQDTLSCLSSLDRAAGDFDVIVVDNASIEKSTVETLNNYASTALKSVTLLQNSHNLGFSGGVNTGITYALAKDYTHIALLNNDAVATDTWLQHLLQAFQLDEKIGIVTGSLLHKNAATIDSTGEMYSVWGLPFPRLRGRSVNNLPISGYIFGATGGATVYRREVFEAIGLFDEKFFAYYEDVDISFRAQLAGWKVYYQQEAVAYHTQGASSSKIPGFTTKQAIQNLPLLYIKNVPGGLLLPIGIRFWPAYSLVTVRALLSPNFKAALTGWLHGVWLFWTHGLPERFKIQRKNRVSSRQINKLLWHDLPPDQTGLRKLLGKPVQ